MPLFAQPNPLGPPPSARQEKPLRARHLHQVHHPGPAAGRLGFRHAGPRRSQLHQGPRHRARQAAHAGQAEARRLRPLLHPQPAHRRHRGQGQQPHRRRRHAAGAGLRRDARRALRLQQQRRRLPVPRPHRPAHPDRAATRARRTSRRPAELWQRYCAWKGIAGPEKRVTVETPYYDDGSGKTPRYYQLNAINRTIEAIARGQNRILLVMATGTGKTYTAFQIIWRLWKSKAKKRILFLADRNILVDQTRTNDFKPFGPAMTKITNRQVDKSYEIYLVALPGRHRHRGREEHLQAVLARLLRPDRHRRVPPRQRRRGLGLARDPRLLRHRHPDRPDRHAQGNEGRLQHRLLRRAGLHLLAAAGHRRRLPRPLQGRPHRPRQGPARLAARAKGRPTSTATLIEDRIYNQKDFDRTLVLEKRTELVARKITEFLKATDRFAKTIVFCEDIDHAERMRQALVNANADLRAPRTASTSCGSPATNEEGKAELDNFIDPEKPLPGHRHHLAS